MAVLSAEAGYQAVSIAQVSSHAGVSSATFYEQFENKEDCLLAAYRAANERTFDRMRRVMVGEREWADAARDAFAELLRGVQSEPSAARVQFIEARAGGPRLLAEIARALDEFELGAEALLANPPAGSTTLDVPAKALVGAVRSLVARHLRTHSEDRLPMIADDIVSWMGSYATPATQERWSVGPGALLPADVLHEDLPAGAAALAIEPLPRGRHRLPAAAVARSQRTRIIIATAEATMAKGYADATVADIVATAGVAKESFYRHFRDKQHAFLESQEHFTQDILDLCVGSFFAGEAWPQRVWSALRTLLMLIAGNPAIAHLRLVECYAAGPDAIRRAEEITRSFTIFLEEGYRQRAEARVLPHLYSQAIAGAIFEVLQREVEGGRTAEIPRLLPLLTYIAIAPFDGPAEATRLVQEMSAQLTGAPVN
jgi:AcrR family transcriptional regulator